MAFECELWVGWVLRMVLLSEVVLHKRSWRKNVSLKEF